MVFCSFSQIIISVYILFELGPDLDLDASAYVTIVRFICLSLLHFAFCNDFSLALRCMKYLAMNKIDFKYQLRAYTACQLSIFATLIIEVLSFRYILLKGRVIDIVENLLKLKII